MLRDSVCDEATNTEECLFDGGDCCLEFKDRTLCQNCSCILSVEPKKLYQQFLDWEIKPLKNPLAFDDVMDKAIMMVQEVVSGQVCAVFCLDPQRGDGINAWQYDKDRQTCQCSWIESTTCPWDLVQTDWTLPVSNSSIVTNWTLNTFVQLEKTIPCCIKLLIKYLVLFLYI